MLQRVAPSRALNNFEARATCNTLPSKTEQLSYRMQYAMVTPMTATQQQPSEAFTIVLSTRQQPSDPLEMLLRATLQLLGCGNLPPDARATARAAVAKALKIYYDNPTDVVKTQLRFRRARQRDRRYLTDVANAFSALRIDEDQDEHEESLIKEDSGKAEEKQEEVRRPAPKSTANFLQELAQM